MSKSIIDELSIGARMSRSVALDRDLYDAAALDGYLITPSAIAALTQLGHGLRGLSNQRAWRVVGPYGSGKSALALVAAQLLAGPTLFPQIARRLGDLSPTTSELFNGPKRCPVAVVGSRVSFGAAFARSIAQIVKQWGGNKAATLLRKNLDEGAGTYRGHPLNASTAQMACDFADAACAEGFDGVVLFIDELGKFVEHAALHPEEGDLMALQQVAEQACGSRDKRTAVVAMLHQHFSSYAAGVGRGLSDEWEKVASRFEEIPFDEPVERYAHFAAHSLGVSRALLSSDSLNTQALGLYSTALALNVLRSHSTSDAELFVCPHRLYPLHPLAIAALAVVAKRYGQSERSFHAFLHGEEPHALRDFAQRNVVGAWYRLAEAFDYLATGGGVRFRDRSAERRWRFAISCVEREQSGALTATILKIVAVLELVQIGLRLPISASLIRFALDDSQSPRLDESLADLVRRGLLFKRRDRDEYTLAVAEVANIEALYEAAAQEDEGKLVLRGVTTALTERLIVANKHYDALGTLRTMGIVVGTSRAWPELGKRSDDELIPDGWLKLFLVTKGTNEVEIAERQFAKEREALTIYACLALQPEARAALVEYSIWRTIQHQLNVRQLDPWASQYVEARLQDARGAVDRLVVAELTPRPGKPGPCYWHKGREIEGGKSMNLSQLASWLFDTVYTQTPRIINELINKDRPPSAIVLARQRMFDVLLEGDKTRSICGPGEYPPERLIHHTLLRDTGIWIESDGHWRLQPPQADAPVQIGPVWETISRMLAEARPPTLADILEALTQPPLGVRAAPAGIWTVLYLIVHRSRCAVIERGTLVLEMTAEHLQRMYKSPSSFELRELPEGDASVKLLSEYRAAFAAVGASVDGDLTYLEVARSIYRWLARLPTFAVETTRLSKEASVVRSLLRRSQDPIKLLAESLPQTHLEHKPAVAFGVWLSEVLTEIGLAHRNLQDAVSGVLSRSFEIAGPLSRVRAELQRECAGAASDLAEANLRTFILRCADLTLTDERWLDSIASLVVQRPLDAWTDDTLGRFEAEVSELCGQYMRWIKVVLHRGQNPSVGERFVSLTLTLPSGHESSVFLVAGDRARRIATALLRSASKEAGDDRVLISAALAQALLQCQTETATESKNKEIRHEHRRAG